MAKLHELLAAEKTPTGAWNQLLEDTVKKFKNPTHFFDGHSKSLKMIDETPQNEALEAQAREEKPVATTVYDTLEYALDIFGKAEDIQLQKHLTDQRAVATVMWHGEPLLTDMPVDELLGLETRLTRLRQLFADIPTLDATKEWQPAPSIGEYLFQTRYPEETVKTEKQVIPITLKEATKEHPAQVQAISKDVPVGKFTTIKRSGAATTYQKSEAIKQIDELMIEVKRARMRANETEVVERKISSILVPLLLQRLR